MINLAVKIYTTSRCKFCVMAKDYFNEHGIDYEEINVESSEKARQDAISKSGQRGVPVIDVDGKIIIGFDKEELDETFGF